MSSSMLAGERKWATARKGGMTVLGKVTVPKPLNLPSQRSENHGMDPNVAIVPKGTLSWGSRGSSSSSDAKISSVSSNADGGAVSPRHRPSSGGSGTRPSTAGSDRNHEPSGAWGSNSRPSSAAGTHPSNQSTLSSRPRSAETRPNSSQLSRFAEPVVKNSLAWGPDIASERLGVKQDGFSLESGDFPTLGADRVDSIKNIEYEDHSRPTSASGTSVQPENNPKSVTDVQCGSFGTWRMEDSQGADESIHPSVDKWQVDPTHYHHANVPPQHFDAWYGPPMNVPHPRAPRFRPPVGPNGPMEPFPYYRPQMPPPHLTGSLPLPPPGASPRGPRPKNGDLYRPHVHDAYARPNMPYRPGFYHGPRGSLPFDGYYGPHTAYHNAEQDIPYMGMGAGHHPSYDGYPRPGAPNLGNSHSRAGGYSPSGKTVTETDLLEDSHRGNRVPRGHERWSQKMVGENWEEKPEPVKLYPRKDYVPPMGINEMGVTEHSKKDAFDNWGAPTENLESIAEHRSRTTENTKPDSFKVLGKAKVVKDSGGNKSEKVAYVPTKMPQVHRDGVTDSSVPAGTNDLALMQKIEGLNAKIRVSDVKEDEASIVDNIKGQKNGSQVEDRKIDDRVSEVSINASGSLKKAPILGDVSFPHESVQPMGAVSRRLQRDEHGGDSYHGKGKFNSQGSDGWRRKGPRAGSSGPSTKSNTDSVMANNPSGYNIVAEVFENSPTNQTSMNEGHTTDSHDESAIIQRVDAREQVKQRALQRQKEEEARAREQKAKAFAKLEELNRRTLAVGESGNHKPGNALASTKNQGEQFGSETTDHKFSESHSDVTHVERNTNQPVESVEDSRNLSSEMLKTDLSVPEALHLPAGKDSANHGVKKVTVQTIDDRGISTLQPARHEQNQKISPGTSLNDRIIFGIASEAPKDHILIGTIDITLPEGPLGETRVKEQPNTSSALVQPSEPQRKKNNHTKNRNRLDATSARALSPVKNEKDLSEKIESGSSLSNFDSSVQVGFPTREVSSPSSKDSLNRGTNQWRNQPSRKLPRGQQANKSTDKIHGSDTVMWAPVRTHTNKAEDSIVSSEESTNWTKDDVRSENIFKGKRADMERYVTKAVVKELSLQETVPSSLSSFRSNESSVTEQPSLTVKSENPQYAAGLASETIKSDGGRYNKHKTEHDLRRQWIAADSSSHTEGGGYLKPGLDKDVELSKEKNELIKGEKLAENLKSSGGSQTSSNKHPPNKDQGMGRGKRQLPRGSRPMGYNTSPENISSIDIEGGETDSVTPDVNRTEKFTASKEIQKSTERSHSHWKPKSRSASGTSVAAEVDQQLAEKDNHEAKAHKVPQHDKEIDKASKPQQVETVQSEAGDESITPSHREFSRDKKPLAQSKSTPTPNHDSTGPGDSTEDQLLHDGSSGFNKHRSQYNRSFRGRDFRPHNPPQVVRERQRQNMHYEYQPIDPSKSTKPRRAENPPPEEAESPSRRYQDRGPSHPKRGGGYYRHHSGAARVDPGHD